MTCLAEKVVILVVDDHPVYIDGITFALQSIYGNLEVLRAQTAKEALALVEERADLDWIFLDYQLPDLDGILVLKQLRKMMVSAPVIMMSGVGDIAHVADAIDQGASGFVHKICGQSTYQECLAAIEAGKTYLSFELKTALRHFRSNVLQAKSRLQDQISGRRLEVLVLISKGYSNAEIASANGISEATVKSHVSSLMAILNADNRSHCVAEARSFHLLN